MKNEGSPRTKGSAVRSWTEWVQERYGADTMPTILRAMPAGFPHLWPSALASSWYPSSAMGEVWAELARSYIGPSRNEQYQVFSEMGRHIAEDNLSTIYRFLLSVMSTDQLLGMTPRLWMTYFDGIEAKAERTSGAKSGYVVVRGLGSLPYVGPVACGWLTLAYEKCGAKSAEVTEENWAQGRIASDRLVFRHVWE